MTTSEVRQPDQRKSRSNAAISAVVFAAGRGTRMGSERSKVLLELNGKPIIHYSIQTLQRLPLATIIVVVGHQADEVRAAVEEVAGERVRFAVQASLLGTGHALDIASRELPPDTEDVLVINGDDSAFYRAATLENLVVRHRALGSIITLLLARRDPNVPFGRVYRKLSGEVEFLSYDAMVARGLELELVATGAYVFDVPWLREHVATIPRYPNGEYPIFELVYLAQQQGKAIDVVVLEDDYEWMSINTPQELAEAEQRMRHSTLHRAPD
ncbi:MAG: NTP transferase domain-containing protein [Chloroflexota bacterium]|nr:NTP transferase domain-containing protein [Chloroflexota bacterium]